MELKKCTRCEIEQNVENFYIRRTRNNQRKSICKECESKQKARKVVDIPNLPNEEWREMHNTDGVYLVSNKGRFRRVKHRKNPTNKLIKPSDSGKGYLQVPLCIDGVNSAVLAHRAVAIAFIPNPDNLPEVDHLDDNKQNNCVENLIWSTSGDNVRRAWKTGLAKSKKGQDHHASKLKEADILFIRLSKLPRKELAKMFGVNRTCIDRIMNRTRWDHI